MKEIELKLRIVSAEDFQALLDGLGDPDQIRFQSNLYLDERLGALAEKGAKLRLRSETVVDGEDTTEHVSLTYKRKAEKKNGVFQRDEIEHPVDPSFLEDPASLTDESDPEAYNGGRCRVIGHVMDDFPHLGGLIPIGELQNERRVYSVTCKGVTMEWHVDKVSFPWGDDHELEVEFADQDAAKANPNLIMDKLDEMGVEFSLQYKGKFSRFLEGQGC
jgi:inorganic triphosphatase YgiF